jgi:hypothetical protein
MDYTKSIMSSMQQERPLFTETWGVIVGALRKRVGEIKRDYGVEAQSLELIEQPQRTVVVGANGKPVVQASISLKGDSINIIAPRDTGLGRINESDSIQVEFQDGLTMYVHDDQGFFDPKEAAEIILNPLPLLSQEAPSTE